MRVAVLHDHLRFIGGGERVALTLAVAFDADLYVTDLDPTLPGRAGMPKVRVYNPEFEQHGWRTGHTVVEVVTDDMPFLVDSTTMELSGHGPTVWISRSSRTAERIIC